MAALTLPLPTKATLLTRKRTLVRTDAVPVPLKITNYSKGKRRQENLQWEGGGSVTDICYDDDDDDDVELNVLGCRLTY